MHISSIKDLELPQSVVTDCMNMMLGVRLGEGASRLTFEFEMNPNWVIKLETGGGFQNIHEHEVWRTVRGTKWEKWFAPVKAISPCGTVLMMVQTAKINDYTKLPRMIPSFFTDVKTENFGLLNNQIVCHDYGLTKMMDQGLDHARMVKASW